MKIIPTTYEDAPILHCSRHEFAGLESGLLTIERDNRYHAEDRGSRSFPLHRGKLA